MPNYDEIKKKARDAFDTIADVSVEAYKLAEEKARILARKAKLTAEITRERAMIRRAKINIGGAYYDLHKDDPAEPLKQFCDDITTSLDIIAVKQSELEDLRKGYITCDEDSEDCECAPDKEEEPKE